MTFLPIVQRELRVAARRRGTYWSRFGAALSGLGLGAWVLLATASDSPQDIGIGLFDTLSMLVFVYTAFVGTMVTCDCLSEEKREGTLGLLFLTDLKGYDVVLGKLAATSINAIYGMLAVMPVLAIPLLLGGVTNGEFWRVVLVSCNLLMFFLTVGIFSSSICRQDNRALAISILLALAIVLAGPLLWLFLSWQTKSAVPTVLLQSPALDCFIAFDTDYKVNTSAFWSNAAITQLYCWVLLALSCRIVPRSWQDEASGEKRGWRQTWHHWVDASSVRRAIRRAQMLEINPFLWRAGQRKLRFNPVWTVVASGAVFCFVLHRIFESKLSGGVEEIITFLLVHTVLKFWLTLEAARTLSDDQRTGALELVLSTPLTERDILRGQQGALRRQFGGPVATVLVADFIFLLMSLRHTLGDERGVVMALYLTAGASLAIDLWALSWSGMWLGLSGRKPNRAAILALLRIIVLPTVVFLVALPFCLLTRINMEWPGLFILWGILGLCTNLYFALSAKRRLSKQFREVVARRFDKTGKNG